MNSIVDEKLGAKFKSNGVNDFVNAFANLHNGGCYTRIEVMVNALHYFKLDDVNEYQLVIHTNNDWYDDKNEFTKWDLAFYKLQNTNYSDYIMHCLMEDFDLHKEAFEIETELIGVHENDIKYILKDFKGGIGHYGPTAQEVKNEKEAQAQISRAFARLAPH